MREKEEKIRRLLFLDRAKIAAALFLFTFCIDIDRLTVLVLARKTNNYIKVANFN